MEPILSTRNVVNSLVRTQQRCTFRIRVAVGLFVPSFLGVLFQGPFVGTNLAMDGSDHYVIASVLSVAGIVSLWLIWFLVGMVQKYHNDIDITELAIGSLQQLEAAYREKDPSDQAVFNEFFNLTNKIVEEAKAGLMTPVGEALRFNRPPFPKMQVSQLVKAGLIEPADEDEEAGVK